MEIPDSGFEIKQLRVSYDGSPKPIILDIEAVGRRNVPYIVERRENKVMFFDLDSIDKSEVFVISTCEKKDGMKWITRVEAEMDEISVRQESLKEQIVGSVVFRQYSYRIGWNRLPSSLEFYSKLRVRTSDPNPTEVIGGSVGGTLAREHKFIR